MGLYQIPQEMAYIDHLIDMADGEITPEIEERIKEQENQIVPRIDSFCEWIRNMEADEKRDENEAKVFKDEIEFYTKRRKGTTNRKERIKKLILDAMKSLGKDKISGAKFTTAVRQATIPRITWEGEGEIPKKFLKVTVEPDKEAIKEAYKNGKLPKGFKVEYSDWLQIK